MPSDNIRTLVFVTWVTAVCSAAIAGGITSLPSWIAVTCAAIVPALVVRNSWRAAEPTLSESIAEARR